MMRVALLILVALLWVGASPFVHTARAQPDSVRTRILEARGFNPNHSPKGALWRAAVAPGWGQFYNHDYVKVPLVWGGLAGMGFLVYWMNDRYVLYRRAALFRLGEEQMMQNEDVTENEWAEYEPEFNEVAALFGENVSSRRLRDRRNFDFVIVGIALVPAGQWGSRMQAAFSERFAELGGVVVESARYNSRGTDYGRPIQALLNLGRNALQALDAYVSAHLLTFDVSDDLSVTPLPTGRLPASAVAASGGSAQRSPPEAVLFDHAATTGPGFTLRVRF